MTFAEDDLLPISALQHLEFCPRQCALIHLEGLWDENILTAEGRLLHDKVHERLTESRSGVRIARSLRLHSFRLGLVGQADVVEFHRLPETDTGGVRLEGIKGQWQPFPVEYKRGRPKAGDCDIVQLCAQAICLEEMLGGSVGKGALYYGQPRRRLDVDFNPDLRLKTESLAVKLHELVKNKKTPPAKYEKKCEKCSLLARCLPRVTTGRKNVAAYLASAGVSSEDQEP